MTNQLPHQLPNHEIPRFPNAGTIVLVLALDTTTRAGSVALVEDDRVVVERAGDPTRSHAERLPGEILTLLSDAGLGTSDVDLFAVASGPGLFTGLRIGIATLQGFAFVHGKKVATVSALEAFAHLASPDLAPGGTLGVWMDAQRRDVFSALYQIASFDVFDLGRLIEVEAPHVGAPVDTARRWLRLTAPGTPRVFAGDGAGLFAESLHASFGECRIVPPVALAGAIGRLAVANSLAGLAMNPADVRPLYVRRPDAEIERERRAGL